jgi:hypothetical protein
LRNSTCSPQKPQRGQRIDAKNLPHRGHLFASAETSVPQPSQKKRGLRVFFPIGFFVRGYPAAFSAHGESPPPECGQEAHGEAVLPPESLFFPSFAAGLPDDLSVE